MLDIHLDSASLRRANHSRQAHHEVMADRPEPARLGRHGTTRPHPWHGQWLVLRETLKLVGQITRAETAGNQAGAAMLTARLATAPAVSMYATSDLGENERGQWIAATIRSVADTLRRRLTLPLSNEAADQQATMFWYLMVCEGHELSDIARNLPKYISGLQTRNKKPWIAERMWATGTRFNVKAGEGLAELTRQIHLRLGASVPGDAVTDAVGALERESLDRMFLEDPAAASWMAVLAHFAPEPIPLEPLAEEVPRGLPHVQGRLDLQLLSTYVEQLVRTGLAAKLDGGSIAIQRAIAQATLDYLDDDLRERALRAAIVLIGMAFPWNSFEQQRWPVSEALAPHVMSVAAHAEAVPLGREDAATLFDRASRYYRARAQFDEAIAAGKRAVVAAERANGRRSPKLAEPLAHLAWALVNNGERVEAEEMFLRALAFEDDEHSQAPAERADILNLYGNLLKSMDRFREAEAVQRRALQLLGADNPYRWTITNDLGRTLLMQDRATEALAMFREALAGLLGADGARIAKRNIGTTLLELRRFEEARDCLEELLAEQEAEAVPDQGFIAWVLRPLGDAYRALGDPRAEKTYSRIAELDQPWVT